MVAAKRAVLRCVAETVGIEVNNYRSAGAGFSPPFVRAEAASHQAYVRLRMGVVWTQL